MPQALSCSVCSTPASEDTAIKRCSRCRERFYCGKDCQEADWPTHKRTCGAVWYDAHRTCRDGSRHEGRLELITWASAAEGTGWGYCAREESDALRARFEGALGRDERALHAEWPQAFRWTCCGTDAGMDWGCDHHGTGSRACTCDFCRMGKALPDNIYNKANASRHGLTLNRGPDPRSFNRASAAIAEMGRSTLGLQM
ncbi:hypothetical protein BJ912DRAFT_938625 [Pholiota molesta]|nr:hypothetical protein BJ912DRAFT_938625 [Pholiota molesta]